MPSVSIFVVYLSLLYGHVFLRSYETSYALSQPPMHEGKCPSTVPGSSPETGPGAAPDIDVGAGGTGPPI